MTVGLHIQQGFVEIDVSDLVDVKAAADKGWVASLSRWSSHVAYPNCQSLPDLRHTALGAAGLPLPNRCKAIDRVTRRVACMA